MLRPQKPEPGLRVPPGAPQPPWVVRIDPRDGARMVLRDTPVLIRLSRPADVRSLSDRSVRVLDPAGPVPARLSLSADGCVVIWQPQRLLVPGVEHVVVSAGLRDCRGATVVPLRTSFVPCGLARPEIAG
jgi:hypothetical protein